MNNIEKNLASVRNNITHTAIDCERDPTKITLLAVSRTKPVADIVAAYQSGQRDFGENYLQEAEHKIIALSDKQIIWHYIGPIQPNKPRKISQLFAWVNSVNR